MRKKTKPAVYGRESRLTFSVSRPATTALISVGLFILAPAQPAFTEDNEIAKQTQSSAPASESSDETTAINKAVEDFFQAISAPAGAKLNRERLNSLFVPGGRILTAIPPKGTTPAQVRIMSPYEYADASDRFTTKNGFFDHVLHNRVEKFGLMAHVYSAYESRNDLRDEKPMVRGVKSIDLLHSDGKWLLVQVFWDTERPDSPIPQEYLQ